MYSIEVRNQAGQVLAKAEGQGDARLIYEGVYQEGDVIAFTAEDVHTRVCVDQATQPAPVYLPGKSFVFSIPFGDKKNGYAPQAFSGELHGMTIGPVEEAERGLRRNIALNPMDQHEPSGCFPHASANVETRGEAQFFARNAIDGHRFNDKHGGWPYHSWGIGERRDAWLRIDFGRPVKIDAAALVLRGDWPHDAWWQEGTLEASDGLVKPLSLVKTHEAQWFTLGERVVEWVCLRGLIKADDPSPFPALTQLEVYGKDV